MAVRVDAAGDDDDRPVAGHPADDRGRKAPPRADLDDVGEPVRSDDREHPLLGLADHHLERLHPGLAPRDRVEVDEHPGPGPIGGLRRGARDAGRAEVLEPLDEAALDELERRLDEELLRERVADLDGRALGGVVVGERGAGEHRRAADAVAAGRRAEQDREVARARAPTRG